jgi:hypothetical protein
MLLWTQGQEEKEMTIKEIVTESVCENQSYMFSSHEEVEPLKEEFEMIGWYSIWGWIKPDGNLLLPSDDMRRSPIEYNHGSLYNNYSKTKESYTSAFDKGFVRFQLEDADNSLHIQCTTMTDIDTIKKGVSNIKNYIKNNSLDVYRIFDRYISLNDIKSFKYELIGKLNEKDVLYSYISEGNNLEELITKLEKYQNASAQVVQ